MKDKKGRVTIPTDLDVVPETLQILEKWGADAIRDCDGTEFPAQLQGTGAKIYSTYYTTRKDNAWAKANPDEIQQCYIMTGFYTARGDTVTIPLMQGISPELMQVNTRDDITRWWEVMDRTTGQPVPPARWSYAGGSVTVQAEPFHEYTVSFLAYLIWDPVHMYNATTNGWTNFEHQITFDVRQPKTHKYTMERLRKFIADHPYVNVIRYTTFFHQFTLIFDELRREKYVDWYGYSASVSPYILEQFEREVGYPFRPEYIIDQGYYNNQYRVPSKEYRDFQAFQRREVAKLAKEMVDITHECGCEAMMFLGDHWIGTEPFMPEFKTIGLDAVVGSVGNGSTLRLVSDIPGVRYTEGRFLPYFFPDTFHEGGRPGAGGQGELGHRPAGHPAQAHRPHRLRRLPEAGPPVPRLHRLCGERLQRVPGAVRQHQGHHPLLRQAGGGAQLLGQDPLLGLPHGPPRPVPEAELQLRRRHRGAERRPLRRAVPQL